MLKSVKINENITLNIIPMDKLKTTSVSLFIHRELSRKDASKNAILPHILKRGTKDYKNTEEIARYLDNLYGAKFSAGISKRGDDHILCLDFETISDKYAPNGEKLLENIIKLMLSVVFSAPDKFDEDVFLQEQTNSITKIENIINDKRIYANYRCQEEMAKGDRFEISRLGYSEDMKKLTSVELHEYYEEIITSSPIDIFICGDGDFEAVETQIRKSIAGMEFKKGVMPKSSILRSNAPVKNITERLNVTQGKLAMGFLTDTEGTGEDFFSLLVGNAIFGGGAQSKLFNNGREKFSLAYYAGSVLDRQKGFLMVNAGIQFENFEKAYKEIMVQLDEMKKGNITDAEFNSSKGFLINSLNSYYDDQQSMISYYLAGKIGGTTKDIEDYKKCIEAVTLEDVKKSMNKVQLNTVYFLTGKEEN